MKKSFVRLFIFILLGFNACTVINNNYLLPERKNGNYIPVYIDGQKYTLIKENKEGIIMVGGKIKKYGDVRYLAIYLDIKNTSKHNYDIIPENFTLTTTKKNKTIKLTMTDPTTFINSKATGEFAGLFISNVFNAFDYNSQNSAYLRRADSYMYQRNSNMIYKNNTSLYDVLLKRHTLFPNDEKTGYFLFKLGEGITKLNNLYYLDFKLDQKEYHVVFKKPIEKKKPTSLNDDDY